MTRRPVPCRGARGVRFPAPVLPAIRPGERETNMETTLTAGQASAIAKALAPAIAKGKDRPALLGVAVDPVTGFSATDGYRAHVVTVPGLDAFPAGVLAGAELVAALKAAAKAAGKGGTVTLTASEADVIGWRVSAGGVTATVPALTCDAVNLAPILAGTLDGETVLPATYNPTYLAALIDAAGAIGDTVRVVKIHDRRPARVESSGDGMTFVGVLMPQRVTH